MPVPIRKRRRSWLDGFEDNIPPLLDNNQKQEQGHHTIALVVRMSCKRGGEETKWDNT